MSTQKIGIYGGGELFKGDPQKNITLQNIIKGKYTTVILWTIHVVAHTNSKQTEGDLHLNNLEYTLASNGKYIPLPNLQESINALTDAGIEVWLSVGCCGAFITMQDIGYNRSSILFKNWQVILNNLQGISGLVFDYEKVMINNKKVSGIDKNILIHATNFMIKVGFKNVIYCVYMDMTTWMDALTEVESTNPGYVSGMHLMSYPVIKYPNQGDPNVWIDKLPKSITDPASFVVPGLEVVYEKNKYSTSPTEMTSIIEKWVKQGNNYGTISGAWVWNLGNIYQELDLHPNSPDASSYARALRKGLGGSGN